MKKLKTIMMGMSVFVLSTLFNVNAAPLQGNMAVISALGAVKSVNGSTYCQQNPSECECIFVNGRWICYIK